MSLITRCPACHTTFKVVPDQLRISEGWVRCGQCDEVFDATANLQTVVPAEQVQRRGSDIGMATSSADMHSGEWVYGETGHDDSEHEPASRTGVPAVEPALLEADRLDDDSSTVVLTLNGEDQGETTSAVGPDETPSFMLEARPQVRPSHGWQRVYALLAAILVLALSVQVVVYERDRIAASAPGVKPLLDGVCALARCSVAPLRQIESVQIDSASFAKLRPDVYRLSLTLRNSTATDLALPAVELSLTDTQDQPLLRRVILASELGLSTDVLAAGSESSVSMVLSVKNEDGAERFAGYRVLAFYP